jgi:hypothetical protein
MHCLLLVWGPAPLGMGFVGAPLATAISFDLIAVLSIIAAVYIHIRDTRYNARVTAERMTLEASSSSQRCHSHCPPQNNVTNGVTNGQQNGGAPAHENTNEETEFYDKNGLRKIPWHPIDNKCLTDYKVLVRLGLSGIGQLAAVWWCWELVGCEALVLIFSSAEHILS